MSSSNPCLANYWNQIDHEKIQCVLCPRYCILKDGQRGFCFVRQNINNELILTTYGRSSGFCIDPIEKKPLNHFYPGTAVLSFGTAGCNLGCQFCQNWDISKSKEFDRLQDEASPTMIAQSAKKTGCKSVAFTYNDPVIFSEYAVDTAKACHEFDIKTVAVTAGYINDGPRKDFFEHIDAANVDLKSFNDEFYVKYAAARLQPVLDTLIYIKRQTGVWLEITTLLIPNENDSPDEISEMCEWVVKELGTGVPLHFSAFHPAFNFVNYPATPPSALLRAMDIAISKGIKYVYTGNIHHPESQHTYCPGCGKPVIQRMGYEIRSYNINDKGKCGFCNEEISGRFDPDPGDWNAKRLPVRI